ncbi:MAG: hypothetical protein J2P33_22250 [Actinobacteria bacterium]|nr:hypothetical protein [Actinomycetota bacterium]
MYDHDPADVMDLGWDEFIARQWEWIFIGYRSATGLRRICRRWSDLFEAGLGCPQEVADLLVRNQIIDRADRDLESSRDAESLVAGMAAALADSRHDLAELAENRPTLASGLLAQHARLLRFIHAHAFAAEPPGLDQAGAGS